MVKRNVLISLLLVVALCLGVFLTACNNTPTTPVDTKDTKDTTPSQPADEAKTYDITVWVSEVDGVKDLTLEQIARYAEANNIKINATVEGISEGDSATQMITSVEDGADIFCFAQDQLARLVQAGALTKLGVKTGQEVTDANSAGSVASAKVGGDLYCYPLTDDNGYFMFYDKSVISEDHIGSLEDLIADCEAAGRNFSFQIKGSAWYAASFFFGTGCVSEWESDSDGVFLSVNDTFNSPEGLIALKGMQKLLKSPAFTESAAGTADFTAAIPSAVVISGTWDVNTAKEALGDNYGVAKLPSFTVDGQTYQLGSFSGCKLLGIKPQTDSDKASVLQGLATYLTGKDCQVERFEKFGWGPSNKEAQESDAVKADEALVALAEQNAFAVPQGQIHGSWWSIALAPVAAAQTAETDEDLQAALDAYTAAINGLFSIDTSGYILVGAWNGWSNSDGNFRMTENDGVYTFTVTVEEGDYMGGRIVTPGNWDTDHGLAQVVEGADLLSEDGGSDNNMVFLAPGTYTVTFTEATNEITVAAQ